MREKSMQLSVCVTGGGGPRKGFAGLFERGDAVIGFAADILVRSERAAGEFPHR